jgi:uncharacterized protein YjbI with pentapeptide repeats
VVANPERRHSDSAMCLRQLADTPSGSRKLMGADLRGADLAGLKLRFVDLSRAQLDDADLSDADLSHVILTGARLRGARLRGSRMQLIEATEADFSGIHAERSRWQHSNLLCARLDGAILNGAVLRNCSLEMASLKEADLTDGTISYSCCDEICLTGARLSNLETFGSTFHDAVFEDAELFLGSHEIIAEVLRRVINHNPERAKLIGAVTLMRHWCYREWKEYLSSPGLEQYMRLAIDALHQYPKSGAATALKEGWDWRRVRAR